MISYDSDSSQANTTLSVLISAQSSLFFQIGMRWQVEKEVILGKGQFICGNKRCEENEGLKSWEINFGYVEHGEKKNALVKLSK